MGGLADTELHQPGKELGVAGVPGRTGELLAPELAMKPPVPNNPVIAL